MEYNITSERIKIRRESLNISQDELALQLGYTNRSTIAKIEKGENKIKIGRIEDFAHALKTSPAYLMGWVDDPELTHEQTLELERQGKTNTFKNASNPPQYLSYGGSGNPKKEELINLINKTDITDEKIDLLIDMIESWQ